MTNVRFVNQTDKPVLAGTLVILKVSNSADNHLVLPKHPDVVGVVMTEVPAGAWGDAEDVGSEPLDDD
jgi:hypothetical protein